MASKLPDLSAYDHLATMIVVINAAAECQHANISFQESLGLSQRNLVGASVLDWFDNPAVLAEVIGSVASQEYSTSRLETLLRPLGNIFIEPLLVQAIVTRMEPHALLVLELVQVEQHVRLEREDRTLDQAQANKELIRNLAHEIKNPLGGIRGAAQLLEMDLQTPGLIEYTQVIIKEADRLQSLVDRLLAPHRKPHVVSDVNIHEVCERIRSLVLAEFPCGLQVQRDYDISLPEFRGDREQLIQAVLNIVHNAAHALADRIQAGDARIVLRTRVARRLTIHRQVHRLALLLLIEDNGPGIPEDLLDRIFFPLVSGKEGGSGLGLTLAQHFVQQHHGLIECESVPGKTVFSITIPLP